MQPIARRTTGIAVALFLLLGLFPGLGRLEA